MKTFPAIMLVGLLCLGVSCRRSDFRTVAVYVPAVSERECLEPIMRALYPYGISPENVAVSLESRMLEIQYDSLHMSTKNIEHLIAGAGFEANGVPADPAAQAALPEPCR